jgi:nicotinamidase-related amidase
MIKKILISFIIILCSANLFSQNDKPMKTALILIDIQQFYFVEGSSQLVQPEAASENAAIMLNEFRKNGNLIVHIQHASKNDMDIHHNVIPLEGEKVITKQFVNSYRETELLDFLNQNKIEKVIICGMMTHVCVEGASRASADYGFEVVVIGDACATRDVDHNGRKVKAADVHASTLATIDTYYGKVMTVGEYLSK